MAAAMLGYEQFEAPTDPQLHITVWYDWSEESTGYAILDLSTTDGPRGKEELKVLEIFQNAIQRALASIRSNDLDDALLAMQDINSTVLLEMQEQFHSDPGSIACQNQRMYCIEDRSFWQQFNICWLAFGQRILDFHCNLNLPPDRLIQLVESAGCCLIAIGDNLEERGLVDYEMGIWEEEILDSK
jgi:hypothetical protein